MTDGEVQPDALRWTTTGVMHRYESCSDRVKNDENTEPLFSAETIQEALSNVETVVLYRCSICGKFLSSDEDAMDCCNGDSQMYWMVDQNELEEVFSSDEQ